MRAVSNSSVLICMSLIGRLDVLHRRFPEGILIPQAVHREVVEGGRGRPGAAEVGEDPGIEVVEVRDTDRVALLRGELDAGEAEALVLCGELRSDFVLLDEKEARRVARRLRFGVLGTVGLPIWARRSGLVDSLGGHLERLERDGRFRLSPGVRMEALRVVGEAE